MSRQVSSQGRLDIALIGFVEALVNLHGDPMLIATVKTAKPLITLGAVHYVGPQTKIGRQAKNIVKQVKGFQQRQIEAAPGASTNKTRTAAKGKKARTVKTGDGIVYEPEWVS